jgi:hypothetical protein
MSSRAPTVDAGIGSDSRPETFVTEELPDSFKIARLGIKQHSRAEMSKLMRRKDDT